ncbi:cell envelope biogenesis protein TolA, partial [Actinomyces oris]
PTQPPTKREPGKPKQNKPQKPHTTKTMRSPQGHGIKNMTHYRVLKQHTQPELNQAF